MLLSLWRPADQLPDESACASVQQRLRVSFSEEISTSGYLRAYDSFDWLLWQKKILLLQFDSSLLLYSPSKGKVRQSYPVSLPQKDIAITELPDDLARRLSPIVKPRMLFPRCSLQYLTRSVAVRDDEDKLLGHLHFHRLTTEGETGEIHGVGVQPLRGYEQPLSDIAGALGAGDAQGQLIDIILAPAIARLAQHGYCSKPQLNFDAQTPVHQVLHDYLLVNLAVAADNIDGILADRDPEFLHDYRVAIRRSRALLSLLKGVYEQHSAAALRQQLADLARPTNRLRDLDVWLLEADTYRTSLPQHQHEGFELLLESLQHQRRTALAQTRKLLKQAPEILRTIHNIIDEDATLSGPNALNSAVASARKAFHKLSSRVRKLCQRSHGNSPDEDIHRIRIECKKLRYLTELFKPVADGENWKTITAALKNLQDCLGHFNDLSVQQTFIATHILTPERLARMDQRAVLAAGGLSSLIHVQQAAEKQRVSNLLDRFAKQLCDLPFDELFVDAADAALDATRETP